MNTESKNPAKKLTDESQMTGLEKFASGGTVTGRWPAPPEAQELPRQNREPVAQVIVNMDFADLERRVLAQLEEKTGIADAMRKALVSRDKDRHKI